MGMSRVIAARRSRDYRKTATRVFFHGILPIHGRRRRRLDHICLGKRPTHSGLHSLNYARHPHSQPQTRCGHEKNKPCDHHPDWSHGLTAPMVLESSLPGLGEHLVKPAREPVIVGKAYGIVSGPGLQSSRPWPPRPRSSPAWASTKTPLSTSCA